jgi:hypothetical protein
MRSDLAQVAQQDITRLIILAEAVGYHETVRKLLEAKIALDNDDDARERDEDAE